MKSEYGMDLRFKDSLSIDEQKFVEEMMAFGKIYKDEDGLYYSNNISQKGSLFAFGVIVRKEKPSILNKLQKLTIHYGDCEDDLIEEGKEKGIM